MKLLIIGATGTIGKAVYDYFGKTDVVISAARSDGDEKVDIAQRESIKSLFKKIGKVDAVVCIAGEAKWAPFRELTEEDYYLGIKSKLMGQVNVVRIGLPYLLPQGSITLSTGILADDPVAQTASAAMVNGGIHSFVRATALELTTGHRLNAVSLGVVADAFEKYKPYFPGHNPIAMEKVVRAYERSVKGKDNGRIIRYYD